MTEEQINRIIDEERGIAREVINLTNEIEQRIQSIEAVPFKEYLVEINDLSINYMLTSFPTLEKAYDWYSNNKRNDGYSFNEKCLYLTLTFINNECDYSEFRNTIQHEVEHYWQSKNANKCISTNRYSLISRECFYSENPIVRYICSLLYFSYKFEIDAYINGAFNTAVKSDERINDYKEYIQKTGLAHIYDTLKNSFKKLDKYSTENLYFLTSINYLKALNVFPKNYQSKQIIDFLKKRTSRSFKYLVKQIGKSFSLYSEKQSLMLEEINLGKHLMRLEKTS